MTHILQFIFPFIDASITRACAGMWEIEVKENVVEGVDGVVLLTHDKCWLPEGHLFPKHAGNGSSTVTSWVPPTVRDGTLLQQYIYSHNGMAYSISDQGKSKYGFDMPEDRSVGSHSLTRYITSGQTSSTQEDDFLLGHEVCWLPEEVLYPNQSTTGSSTATRWMPPSVRDGSLLQGYISNIAAMSTTNHAVKRNGRTVVHKSSPCQLNYFETYPNQIEGIDSFHNVHHRTRQLIALKE